MNIPSINTSMPTDSMASTASGPRGQTLGKPSANEQSSAPMDASIAAAAAGIRPGLAVLTDEAKAPAKPVALEQVQQAMEEVRNAIAPVAQDLLFSIDEDTGKTIVKVVDASTDEVIRQIPSEEIISIAKALDKLQGLLVEQKA